jgi:hypothetical protein
MMMKIRSLIRKKTKKRSDRDGRQRRRRQPAPSSLSVFFFYVITLVLLHRLLPPLLSLSQIVKNKKKEKKLHCTNENENENLKKKRSQKKARRKKNPFLLPTGQPPRFRIEFLQALEHRAGSLVGLVSRRPLVGHENTAHPGRQSSLDADRSVLEDEHALGRRRLRVEFRGCELEDLRVGLALASVGNCFGEVDFVLWQKRGRERGRKRERERMR